VLAKVTMS